MTCTHPIRQWGSATAKPTTPAAAKGGSLSPQRCEMVAVPFAST